jgi:hypothetical protein
MRHVVGALENSLRPSALTLAHRKNAQIAYSLLQMQGMQSQHQHPHPHLREALEMDSATLFRERLAALQTALIANTDPALPRILADIKTHILQDPEQVTIMSREEIGMIVRGLIKQTGIAIAPAKKKATSLKALAADDDCI